jgi:hypothetical protein
MFYRGLSVHDNGEELTMILEIHHALYDGISYDIIVQEFSDILQDFALPSPTKYRDFVDYVLSQDQIASEVYWSNYLADVEPCNDLVFVGEASSGYNSVYLKSNVSKETLKSYAQSIEVTLPSVF